MQKFWYQQGKNRARRAKMDPKNDTFGQVGIRDLAILGVEKTVFWTFRHEDKSCEATLRVSCIWVFFVYPQNFHTSPKLWYHI